MGHGYEPRRLEFMATVKKTNSFPSFMGDMQGKETETSARPIAPGEGLEATVKVSPA